MAESIIYTPGGEFSSKSVLVEYFARTLHMMNFDNRLATSDWEYADNYSQLGDFKGSEIKISKVCN